MRNLKVALAAACAVVVGWALTASADIPASAYVQDGLMVQLDGVDNVGLGFHKPDADEWVDLTGNASWKLGVGSWSDGCALVCPGTGVAASRYGTNNVVTAEICFERDAASATEKGVVFYCGSYCNTWGYHAYYGFSSAADNCLMLNRGKSILNVASGEKTTISTVYTMNKLISEGVSSVYRDGVLGTVSSAYTSYYLSTSSKTAAIGSTENTHFKGKVYAVRLYDRALSEREISIHAALDRIRFMGETEEVGGYRWNPQTGQVELLLKVVGVEGAEVSADGESWSASTNVWVGWSVRGGQSAVRWRRTASTAKFMWRAT